MESIITTIQPIIIFVAVPWVAWVTKSIFDMNKEQSIAKVQYQEIKEDLKEIKSLIYDLTYKRQLQKEDDNKIVDKSREI